jgi:hypothetical protein
MALKTTSTAIYVSPGVKVDAGGFIIVNGKFKKVPPRGPEFNQLEAGVSLVLHSGNIKSKELQQKVLVFGQKLITETIERLIG